METIDKKDATPVAVEKPAYVPGFSFAYAANRLPHCCGVTEIGRFEMRDYTTETIYKAHINTASNGYSSLAKQKVPTKEEAAKRAFKAILNDFQKVGLQFWFYKAKSYDGGWEENYQASVFRDVVRAHPGVIELAEYINPNSGNIVNGYLILNGTNDV